MKSILLTLALICGVTFTLFGQTIVDALRGVEVTGTAERMVTPDQLTFRITLAERMGSRGKVTLEQQEGQLRTELEKIGVDLAKDLSIYDISSNYVRRRRDVLAEQDYRLVIHDLNKVGPLQDVVERIKAESMDLVLAENLHVEDIRRELRSEAIRSARAKAESLMAAVGAKVGDPIYVREVADEPRTYYNNYGLSNMTTTAANYARPLSFAPEKVKAVIVARFEITK